MVPGTEDLPPVRIALRDRLERHARLGQVVAQDLALGPHEPALWARIEALEEELRQRYRGTEPSSVPVLNQVRAMYHATGTDPTKRRPSSEALLRRVLRGQQLHRINTLVDLTNYLSLQSLLPIGLYDLGRVEGDIELRLGRPGEPYEAIGREAFSVTGRMVLADARGPFGSPTSDSTRTMIRPETRRALAVFFAPAGYPAAQLQEHLAGFAEGARLFCGGTVFQSSVAPPANGQA